MKENAVLQTNIVETEDETEKGTYLTIKNKVMSDGISGGLVGAVKNSTVNVSYIEKDIL